MQFRETPPGPATSDGSAPPLGPDGTPLLLVDTLLAGDSTRDMAPGGSPGMSLTNAAELESREGSVKGTPTTSYEKLMRSMTGAMGSMKRGTSPGGGKVRVCVVTLW
jgi:hypothetical protein